MNIAVILPAKLSDDYVGTAEVLAYVVLIGCLNNIGDCKLYALFMHSLRYLKYLNKLKYLIF
tara:strand:- start:3545 stop:3730 length:186 start_codon:yes stop_codon:yes gene_type:complete